MNFKPIFLVLISNFACAQDCSVLNELRTHARSNFSNIAPKIDSHPSKVKSSLLLPNAQSCTIQTYSSTEAKYVCEWALIKELENGNLALSIYNSFVNDLASCAGSTTQIDHRHSNQGSIEQSANFIDSHFKNIKQEISIRINLEYFSHWWIMKMDYSKDDKDE